MDEDFICIEMYDIEPKISSTHNHVFIDLYDGTNIKEPMIEKQEIIISEKETCVNRPIIERDDRKKKSINKFIDRPIIERDRPIIDRPIIEKRIERDRPIIEKRRAKRNSCLTNLFLFLCNE